MREIGVRAEVQILKNTTCTLRVLIVQQESQLSERIIAVKYHQYYLNSSHQLLNILSARHSNSVHVCILYL